MPARKRTKLGLARTYQQSRMLLGLSVEDSIYLAALGVGSGHLRPVTLPKKDGELRGRARAAAGRVAIDHKLDWETSPTASTARSRSRWLWSRGLGS